MDRESLQAAAIALCPEGKAREKADRAAVAIPVHALVPYMRKLHDQPEFSFDLLELHTAVDWLAEGRIELVYLLHSMKHGHYLLVSTSVPRDAAVAPSVSDIWSIAEWHEREVYDMFGVKYSGHPDLRRLMLEDSWQGFPLRKDYKDDFILERPGATPAAATAAAPAAPAAKE